VVTGKGISSNDSGHAYAAEKRWFNALIRIRDLDKVDESGGAACLGCSGFAVAEIEN
jgi:hypothetical protein